MFVCLALLFTSYWHLSFAETKDQGRTATVIFLSAGSAFVNGDANAQTKTRMFHMGKKVWCDSQPLPIPTESHALVAFGDKAVFIAGGHGNKSTFGSTDVWVYDPQNDSYSKLGDLMKPYMGMKSVEFDGKIYAVSGYNLPDFSRNTEIYNGKNWKLGPKLHKEERMTAAVAVTARGVIWSIGDYWSHQNLLNVLTEYLDTAKGLKWINGPRLNVARGGNVGASAIENTVYVCGGYSNGTMISDCEKLDGANGNWVKVANMLQPRVALSLLVLDGKLYAVGGRRYGRGDEDFHNSIEVYDPVLDQWSMFAEWEEKKEHFGTRGQYIILQNVPETYMRCP